MSLNLRPYTDPVTGLQGYMDMGRRIPDFTIVSLEKGPLGVGTAYGRADSMIEARRLQMELGLRATTKIIDTSFHPIIID